MNTAKQIGENLRIARKSKGLMQKEVAEKLFMTQQQYSRFENNSFGVISYKSHKNNI